MSPSPRKGFSILLFLFLVVLGGLLFLLLKDLNEPLTAISPEQSIVSKHTEFIAEAADPGSGVKSLAVVAVQGDRQTVLLEKTYAKASEKVFEKFTLQNTDLADGPFVLNLLVQDASYANFGGGNRVRLEQAYELDTVPPRILLQSETRNVTQGGSCCVSYTLDAAPEKSGVYLRDMFFPGYRQENGTYVCIFPFPYYMDPETFRPILAARDAAGNRSSVELHLNARAKEFKSDVINLPQSFLDRKMPEFEQVVPGEMTNLERFLKVNRELRAYNREALQGLSRDTSPLPLWHGAFVRMRGAATKATFGDHRSYVYEGKEVDNQIHLGVDLASVRHDDIPAANDGRVVFADIMGIYGLVAIIDHGLGLQTLYGHLSQMSVAKGDTVTKGQIIGKSGVSGMAGGDHLHFGTIVGGIPVNPIEWWDDHWLRVNLGDMLPGAVGTKK